MARKTTKSTTAHDNSPMSCAFDGCKNTVTPDDYCHGCKQYVCEEHSTNYSLFGAHSDVSLHWTEEDAED
jgi:hypothetical protein